jgi:hypothetical protein
MAGKLTLKEILTLNPHIKAKELRQIREKLAKLSPDDSKPEYGLASPLSRRRVRIGERHGHRHKN